MENVEKFIKQAKSYDYEVQAPKTTRLKHLLRTLLFLYYGPAKLARLGVNTEGRKVGRIFLPWETCLS